MYNKILVSYDGSDGSTECLKTGSVFAKIFNAKLTAIWVGGYKPYYHETKAEIDEERLSVENFAKNLQHNIEELKSKESIDIDFVYVIGNPAKEIISYAKRNNFDLIIIGHKGHSGLWESLGHVAEKVSENAHCNVLIVRKKQNVKN